MYLEHFKLQDYPFRLTPDTGFYFNWSGHQDALNVLLVALRSGEGFIKITGEVGTGKTLLCRRLLNHLKDGFTTAYLPNPLLSPRDLYLAVVDELGLPRPSKGNVQDLLKLLYAELVKSSQAGKPVVILLDEAQTMPTQSLEALRLLSNLETEKRKLLHIVLFGQPELDRRLAETDLRQLRQRIAFSHRLPPLDRKTLQRYLDHRLHCAGHAGSSLFSRRALVLLQKASRGIPRLVNVLGHKAMLAAYGQGSKSVSSRHLRAAITDTEDVVPVSLRWIPWTVLGCCGLAVLLTPSVQDLLQGGWP